MTKKQAGVISVIAFVALIRQMGNLIGFADLAWYAANRESRLRSGYAGC